MLEFYYGRSYTYNGICTMTRIDVNDEQAMQHLGERLARAVDSGIVMILVGDVGAGKTTLVRGIARGLGVDETVQSPSFTISRVYDGAQRRLVHYDFYRLDDPGIMANELAEAVASDDVIVIEWSAIIENIVPQDHIIVKIMPLSDTTRQVTLQPTGPRSDRIVKELG